MEKYHKIKTIYKREYGKIVDKYIDENLTALKDIDWIMTEKIDGMNIRVIWNGYSVSFAGRTDKAIIPPELVAKLEKCFGGEDKAQIFEMLFGDNTVILFGEGYGSKIQSNVGQKYNDEMDFILFDVLIENSYQPREFVENVAKEFSINIVPIVLTGKITDGIKYVAKKPNSIIAKSPVMMEGLVIRPLVELKYGNNARVIYKIKYNDIKELYQNNANKT